MSQESDVLKSLGDETRLRVLNLFLSSGVSLCVCEIVDALGIPQYSISKHLTTLRHAGLVTVEKEGLWGYYRLRNEEEWNRALLAFLRTSLSRSPFVSDTENLKARLSMREQGKCVVGLTPHRTVRTHKRSRQPS